MHALLTWALRQMCYLFVRMLEMQTTRCWLCLCPNDVGNARRVFQCKRCGIDNRSGPGLAVGLPPKIEFAKHSI